MEYRNLEITVNSGKDLKNVNFFTKMDVYAIVMIAEDSRTALRTPISMESGRNPNWNYKIRFAIDETAARENRLRLVFQIKSKRILGDREVGIVTVPVKDLIDGDNNGERLLSYALRSKKGKSRGTLNFSCKLGDKIDFSNPAAVSAAGYGGVSGGGGKKYGDEPVMAYPVTAGASSYAYPPQQAGAAGYSYPPPQQGHGYPPQYAAAGYGGAGRYQQPHYGAGGYGGYAAPHKPPRRMGGMGMGLGAGLLGGLLVGDMIDDVGDMGGGYDGGGFDGGGFDGGGFDF